MNTPSKSSPSRRLFRVIAITIALPLIALVPAFLASSAADTRYGRPNRSWPNTPPTIDVTDIDPEGTVMYTVSPPNGDSESPDSHLAVPRSLLDDADMLHITIRDDDDPDSWLGQDSEGNCNFTLHFDSDDPYDEKTETFTGYIRVTDEETKAYDNLNQREDCGIYLTFTE